MQHAIELRPEIRKAHELHDVVEHGVSPTGVVSELVEAFPAPTGHSFTRERRRLSLSAPALCPTMDAEGEVIRDSSPFGEVVHTTDGAGQIELYDTRAGYASSLFCQWHVMPATGSSQMSLVFDKFDVPVGFDSLKVYQLKCLEEEPGCTRREKRAPVATSIAAISMMRSHLSLKPVVSRSNKIIGCDAPLHALGEISSD